MSMISLYQYKICIFSLFDASDPVFGTDMFCRMNGDGLQCTKLTHATVNVQQLLLVAQGTGTNVNAAAQQQAADQIKFGIIIVSTLPLLVLYPFLQKYFNKGVMLGAVKG